MLKTAQIPNFHFPKVVHQPIQGDVGKIIWFLLQIYLAFQQCKNF